MLKSDSTHYPSVEPTHASGPEWPEPDVAEAEAGAGDVVAFAGKKDLPFDLAVDLRLHEILQQARLTTTSSGAVIALARGNRMVCRASLGDKAPGVGVFLNTRSGLAGACVQTREMQLCDDTLVDPRVNATACSDLGIRSIAAQPVLDGEELWGVLEVFSLVPNAYSDSDLQELQGLSRKVLRTVQEAMYDAAAESATGEVAAPLATDFVEPEPAGPETSTEPVQPDAAIVRRDYRTGILTAAVLAMAVLLGWMVGRVGWSMAVNRAPAPASTTAEEAQAMAPVVPEAAQATPRRDEPPASAKTIAARTPPASAMPVEKRKTEPALPAGGLVVYEKGKVVFRMPPAKAEATATADVMAPRSIQKAATREEDDPAAPDSPSAANDYLLVRVEPEYPEAARQQGIQGPVVLKVLVGADGLVEKLTPISGDPQLVQAARDAVWKWHFMPHQRDGKAVEFETEVTVNFVLP
ncbi:MAG: TonB family protein [Terriglobales bacterium]